MSKKFINLLIVAVCSMGYLTVSNEVFAQQSPTTPCSTLYTNCFTMFTQKAEDGCKALKLPDFVMMRIGSVKN